MFNFKKLLELKIRIPSLIMLITTSQDRWIFPSQCWEVRKSMMMMMMMVMIIIMMMKTVLLTTLRHPYHPSLNVMRVNKINKRVKVCWQQKNRWLIALLLWRFPRLRPFVVLVVWRWRWLRGLLEFYLRGATEVIEENPVPVPICPPKVSHGMVCNRAQSSAVRVRPLTAWAVAWNFED